MAGRSDEAVLLLHGMWMNRWVLQYLAWMLKREGFLTEAVSFRPMRDALADHLRRLAHRVAASAARRVHLVGHSFGGLVALRYLQRGADQRAGRGLPRRSRACAARGRSVPVRQEPRRVARAVRRIARSAF